MINRQKFCQKKINNNHKEEEKATLQIATCLKTLLKILRIDLTNPSRVLRRNPKGINFYDFLSL